MCIIRVSEERQRKEKQEYFKRWRHQSFQNLMRTMKLHIPKIPHMKNSEIHTDIPETNCQNPNAKTKRSKNRITMYKRSSIRWIANFPSGIIETRGNGEGTLKVKTEKSFKQELCIQQDNSLKLNKKKIEKHKIYEDWECFHYQTWTIKNIKVLHTETLE